MISIENTESLVAVTVFCEFTLADYKEFEELVNYQIQFHAQDDLLFDLRAMTRFPLDVAWEEIKFLRPLLHGIGRIAELTDSEWVILSAWLSQPFVEPVI